MAEGAWGDETVAVLADIAYLRRMRAELEPLAVPSAGGRRSYSITSRQRVAIFDLLRTIDHLFPGGPVLYAV